MTPDEASELAELLDWCCAEADKRDGPYCPLGALLTPSDPHPIWLGDDITRERLRRRHRIKFAVARGVIRGFDDNEPIENTDPEAYAIGQWLRRKYVTEREGADDGK